MKKPAAFTPRSAARRAAGGPPGARAVRLWIARILMAGIVTGALLLVPSPEARAIQPEPSVVFEAVQVFVDTGPHALAAYQFELTDPAGTAAIVGVEGGDHPAFQKPPYYDPAALRNHRIILAAFHLQTDAPRGTCAVAVVHLMVPANRAPDYRLVLNAAADPDGRDLRPSARIHWQRKKD